MTCADTRNVDAGEVDRFERLAAEWWDPDGRLRTLHDVNPLRVEWIERRAGGLAGRRALDVGCGGGLLAQALAARGATTTAIDASGSAIAAARAHAGTGSVEYRVATAEEIAEAEPARYDVVACLELVEHVPDPASLVHACARLARPGGHVFLSTINRTARAWLLAIVGAEHVLGLIPRGTHEYAKLVRPSELDAWGRRAGLRLVEIAGVAYNPVTRRARLGDDVGVNYLAWLRAPADD